ncbi:response regulator, partial [Lysobacter sp. A3-1-A15]
CGTVFAVRVASASAPPQAASGGTTDGLKGLRVLLVDNDPQALSALAGVLRQWGCEVATAGDRLQAERRMGECPASLWLFDYHLDDGDTGVALAADLADRHGARPTLILSADSGHAVRRAVLDAGYSLLAKPSKPLALKSVLDRLLAAREA